jgi:hypothetical protein
MPPYPLTRGTIPDPDGGSYLYAILPAVTILGLTEDGEPCGFPITTPAMIDTGATITAVYPDLVKAFDVESAGSEKDATADQSGALYRAQVAIPDVTDDWLRLYVLVP